MKSFLKFECGEYTSELQIPCGKFRRFAATSLYARIERNTTKIMVVPSLDKKHHHDVK